MRNRLLAAFVLTNLALVAALAWFVLSKPDAGGQPGGTTMPPAAEGAPVPSPALGKFRAQESAGRMATGRPVVPPAPPGQSKPASAAALPGGLPHRNQPNFAPRTDREFTALSGHIAYGPMDAGTPQPGIAGASGKQEPANLPPEFLDLSPVAVPLALLDPVPSTLSSPEQVAALDKLRASFASAVGGPRQDPASKDYRDHWKAAQPSADERYRQWFGYQAFAAQQRAQHLELHPPVR